MTTAQRNIHLPIEQILAFCRRNPIEKLSLFGSVLRDDFSSESDVDFLIEFQPDSPITYFRMVDLEMELGKIIGRKADLRTPRELGSRFRQKILETAEPLYARE